MTRSQLMARIKSRGNKSTELAFAGILRRERISGWRRHARVLGIRPDFVFRKHRLVVFVDGCFWHWCIEHCGFQNLGNYWRRKIMGNYVRDCKQNDTLQRAGWHMLRVWEHSLKNIHDAERIVAVHMINNITRRAA